MHVTIKKISATKRRLTISGNESDLTKIKSHAIKNLIPKVSAPGFRKGKVPARLVEKQLGDQAVQAEVLEEAVNHLFSETIIDKKIRPLDRPKIQITKFVPYSEIVFTAEIEIVPPIDLADYRKIRKQPKPVKVTDVDVEQVIEKLRYRLSDKKEVARAAITGDEVIIDFSGADNNGNPLAGASGKDYPLIIGSKSFIPGFEDNLVGLKSGDSKEFVITFPKDYGYAPHAGTRAFFQVTVKHVQSVGLPKVDNAFAAKAGQFNSVKELMDDIRLQLSQQKIREADDALKDAILEEIIAKSTMVIPDILLQDQLEQLKQDHAKNLTYRGITHKEYLDKLGLNEAEWIKQELQPTAELRVKVGMVLNEVADKEELKVSQEEVRHRISQLQQQYDQPAQAEFDKPETRRDIASRLLTEKTMNKLVAYATQS